MRPRCQTTQSTTLHNVLHSRFRLSSLAKLFSCSEIEIKSRRIKQKQKTTNKKSPSFQAKAWLGIGFTSDSLARLVGQNSSGAAEGHIKGFKRSGHTPFICSLLPDEACFEQARSVHSLPACAFVLEHVSLTWLPDC